MILTVTSYDLHLILKYFYHSYIIIYPFDFCFPHEICNYYFTWSITIANQNVLSKISAVIHFIHLEYPMLSTIHYSMAATFQKSLSMPITFIHLPLFLLYYLISAVHWWYLLIYPICLSTMASVFVKPNDSKTMSKCKGGTFTIHSFVFLYLKAQCFFDELWLWSERIVEERRPKFVFVQTDKIKK